VGVVDWLRVSEEKSGVDVRGGVGGWDLQQTSGVDVRGGGVYNVFSSSYGGKLGHVASPG